MNTESVIEIVSNMVKEYWLVSGQEPTEELYARLVKEEGEEWDETSANTVEELKEASDYIYVLVGQYLLAEGEKKEELEQKIEAFCRYCKIFNLQVLPAVARVHKNNLARMYQDDGTILRREDGKIIKNPNTPKVYLEDLVW